MIRHLGLSALILGLAACSAATEPARDAAEPARHADAVFTDGRIYTGVDGQPTAELVAVRDGRIVYVGDRDNAAPLIGPGTETHSLGSAVMFPGFTDSHAHIIGVGSRERNLNLEGTTSITDLQARVAAAAEDATASLIFGRGWIETHWPEERFPTASDLDAVESDRPVILIRADGHALVANSAAIEAVGYTADTPDPEGGAILKDATGAPNGMMIDTAMAPFAALQGEPEGEERAMLYQLGADVMAASGWTGVHDMSVTYADVDIMSDLAEAGRFPIRVSVYANPEDYDAVASGFPRVEANGRVIANGVKFYMDGALGSRGAALLSPYDDAPEITGLFLSEEARAEAMMQRALQDGVQLAIHAIGDAGNREVLNWMEDSLAAIPPQDRTTADPRWRVEHAQVLHPDDIPRFGALGIIASMQPSHAIGDLHFAASRIGLQRLEGAYAWRSLIDTGARIAGGSDAPVERGEARIEFYAAAVRRDLNGFADVYWGLDQALDRQTALKLFTLWPAYATFQEDELGTIEVGKIADFSVFDRDLMTVPDLELRDARPVMTVVDGDIVWRAE